MYSSSPTCCLLLMAMLLATEYVHAESSSNSTRLCFPRGFLLGSATAAYQVEGAWNEDGRTASIWDDYCRNNSNVQCANVAGDFYHRYREDIQMMKLAGHQTFRLSISWSRVMHWNETLQSMEKTPDGLRFYHQVMDELAKNGIQPILTLYHFDLPAALHTQLSPPGWLNPNISDHFLDFATLIFQEFGQQVLFWATFNEPLSFVVNGYGVGNRAPGLSNSTSNTYDAAHNVLLSHGKAVRRFRELKQQQVVQDSAKIGIVLNCDHAVPADAGDLDDVSAVERALQFYMGWFLGPIVNGEYPRAMRARAGERLPRFSPEQAELVKGSYDVFMLNHYSTHTVTSCDSPRAMRKCANLSLGWERDLGLDNTGLPPRARQSSPGPDGALLCPLFSAVPTGYREVLRWLHGHNTSTEILLTENGFCGNAQIHNMNQLWYHQTYLEQVFKAMTEDNIPILGYTAWSLMDNYEWGSFNPRFGLYFVNYTSQAGSKESWTPQSTDLQRIPRPAAKWFANVAQTGCMEAWQDPTTPPPSSSSSLARLQLQQAESMASKVHKTNMVWMGAMITTAVIAAGVVVVVLRRRRPGTAGERAALLHR